MYILKLLNADFQIYRLINCHDKETAMQIATDLKVNRFVICKLIVDGEGFWTREVCVYGRK